MTTEINTDYYAYANPNFLKSVAEYCGATGKTAKVLDVGCWNGSLGRALMAACDVIVDGIEVSPLQGKLALESGYRTVYTADLNTEIPKIDTRYDFVLFGDVLEHLIDPWQALAMLSRLGKPDGRILLSIPNVGFALNRITHLLGRWDYRDYGIMDRTHLRFFTYSTMLALVESADLKLTQAYGFSGLYNYSPAIRLPARWLARLWPALFAIQIVMEAERVTELPTIPE